MASKYTAVEYFGSGSMSYRGYLEAAIAKQDDLTATIKYTARVQMRYAYLYGVGIKVTNGASKTGYLTSNPGANWKNVCTVSGTFKVNKKASEYKYKVSAKAYGTPVNGIGAADSNSESVSVEVSIPARAYDAPSAVTGVSNTRVSDTRNNITWTNNAASKRPYTKIYIERSINGAAWSKIASVNGTATSYADTSTSANNYYRYRVRPYNPAGYAAYATTGYTYNTPAAPFRARVARASEASVTVTIDNPARTATALEVQRSSDFASWETVATVSGIATSASDSPGGGTYYYRVRNTRGALASAWTNADEPIITACAPNPPTLTTPAAGETISTEAETITFAWKHNALDGSTQTRAEINVVNSRGVDVVNYEVTGSNTSITIDNTFDAGQTLYWSVRTKGVHVDWSSWSSTSFYYVKNPPSVAFPSSWNSKVIRALPVDIQLDYDDPDGELMQTTITISDENGAVVYTKAVDGSASLLIPASEWLPQDKATYLFDAVAVSTSSLSASASAYAEVSFSLPSPASADWTFDKDSGAVDLTLSAETGVIELEPAIEVVAKDVQDGALVVRAVVNGACSVTGEPSPQSPSVITMLSEGKSGSLAIAITDDAGETSKASVVLDGETLNAINGVSDRLTIADDDAIISRAIEGITLTASSWTTPAKGSFVYKPAASNLAASGGEVLCNRFPASAITLQDDGSIRFDAPDVAQTVSAWKEWIVANETVLYYERMEEREINLGSATFAQLPAPTFTATVEANMPATLELSITDGFAEVESMLVRRVYGEVTRVLGDGLEAAASITDRYAPLGVPYVYEVVTIAASGAVNATEVPVEIDSTSIYYLYNEADVARIDYGATWSSDFSTPEAEEVLFWGSKYPKRYNTGALSETGKDEGHLLATEDWQAVERLVKSGGLCVRKSPRGAVFWVGLTASVNDENNHLTPYLGTVSVSWTRVAGEDL